MKWYFYSAKLDTRVIFFQPIAPPTKRSRAWFVTLHLKMAIRVFFAGRLARVSSVVLFNKFNNFSLKNHHTKARLSVLSVLWFCMVARIWHLYNIEHKLYSKKIQYPSSRKLLLWIWSNLNRVYSTHRCEEGNLCMLETYAWKPLPRSWTSLPQILFSQSENAWLHLKLHLAYVLRWNRGKNIYFFSHI